MKAQASSNAVVSQALKERDASRKRGDVRGEGILVRFQPALLARLDDVLDGRSRPEAIRSILDVALPK